jgi:uncharacterized protein DUF4365
MCPLAGPEPDQQIRQTRWRSDAVETAEVSRQPLIGEGAVSLIAWRVNEMGFLYHDRRVDHGIDGEIEIVAADGGAVNAVIMVQSKDSNRRHGDRGPVAARRRIGLVVRCPGRVQRPAAPGRAHGHHRQAYAVLRQVRGRGDHAARRAARLGHLPRLLAEEGAAHDQPPADRRQATISAARLTVSQPKPLPMAAASGKTR